MSSPDGRWLVVVCYDVADDGRRRRVDRVLRSAGVRVQESVFECVLSRSEAVALRTRLARLLAPPADSVRFYALCQRDRRQARADGGPPVSRNWDYRVV